MHSPQAAVEASGDRLPRVVLSREIPQVAELGRRVVKALGLHGFVNTEFKRDSRTGDFHLIEINARHNMSAGLAVRCGVNMPLIEYEHRVEGKRPARQVAETGVYWISLEWELREARRLARRGELSRNLLRPYARPHVYDVLDWRDPAPFAKLMKDWAQNRKAESGETEERPTVGLAASTRRFSRGGNASTSTGSRPRFAA